MKRELRYEKGTEGMKRELILGERNSLFSSSLLNLSSRVKQP